MPQQLLDVSMDDFNSAEIGRAIMKLKNSKAAGEDQITAEMLKYGGKAVIQAWGKLLNSCWQEEHVPSDWRNGVIVKIPKKGNLANCNNWRGVTLLSIPGKVLSILLLDRLNDAIDDRLREQQAGFRKGRSCCEQIFALRNIIEQCYEFQQQLEINFIDFKKAFDSVHRDSLWKIAELYGIPAKYINIIKNIYHNSSCYVKTQEGHTDYFGIETGVRQGCVLSPLLFLLVIDYIMRKAIDGAAHGMAWAQGQCLADLDFADDIALLANNRVNLQRMTNNLHDVASKVGLRISQEKTKTIQVRSSAQNVAPICIDNHPVEEVESFAYLGSVITSDGGADVDVKVRIGKAAAIFRQMGRISNTSSIDQRIKMQLYNTIVLPTALYASETWKKTAVISKRLDVFHQRCLRKILKISYLDHVTNENVLNMARSRRLQDIVTEKRMQLAGHILRLPTHRIAKTALTWTPAGGKRGRGRPKCTWRRTFKEDLTSVRRQWHNTERLAANRDQWRIMSAQCASLRGKD